MIKAGDNFPEIAVHQATAEGPEEISTTALLANKKTALFALPGAFTPTCSAKHLPGFVAHADDLAAKGIDQIVCVSVNDAFVMQAWGESAGVGDKIIMLADGNGRLAQALGLTMDASAFGMGERAQRFSMIIDDGKVAVINIEEPGNFEVSSADYMLNQL